MTVKKKSFCNNKLRLVAITFMAGVCLVFGGCLAPLNGEQGAISITLPELRGNTAGGAPFARNSVGLNFVHFEITVRDSANPSGGVVKRLNVAGGSTINIPLNEGVYNVEIEARDSSGVPVAYAGETIQVRFGQIATAHLRLGFYDAAFLFVFLVNNPPTTPERPISVKISERYVLDAQGWHNIIAAISSGDPALAGKYVSLDLSACRLGRPGTINNTNGGISVTDNAFRLNAVVPPSIPAPLGGNLVELILPSHIVIVEGGTNIFPDLRRVTIPTGVTTIEANALNGHAHLNTVTFLGSAANIDPLAFDDNLDTAYMTVYNHSPGTYVRSSSTWTRNP
jgi:hypothetical protein